MMKRTIKIVAAVALLVFAAGSAQALSSINLIWRTTGTSTIDTNVDGLGPHILDVVLVADSVGIVATSLGFAFDTDLANELNFVTGGELSSVNLPGMGNAFAPLLPGFQSVTESTGILGGLLEQFDQSAGLSTGAISVTRTLGSITFTVNGGLTDGIDVQSGFFTFGIDGAAPPGGGLVPLSFGGATVNGAVVPEPTTAALIVLGLAGLGLAGRRSVR